MNGNSIERARLLAERESLAEKQKAVETELALLKKADDVPVLRMDAFSKLSPQEKADFCRDVRAGKAKLID